MRPENIYVLNCVFNIFLCAIQKSKIFEYMGMVFASLGMIASFLGYGMNLNREELVDHY